MKLKKIASLAMAGVMAVSMLAGCNGNSNNGNNGGNNNGPIEPVTSTVVDAVNNGQDPTNDVKVNFTVNSDLDAALAKAIEVYGTDATNIEVGNLITRLTGLKTVGFGGDINAWKNAGLLTSFGFINGNVNYYKDYNDKVVDSKVGNLDGDVYTLYSVSHFSATSEEAALNQVAEAVDEMVAELAEHSNPVNKGGKPITSGSDMKYYGYSYDGNISMVSVTTIYGVTNYYVVCVLNQTVAEKTM